MDPRAVTPRSPAPSIRGFPNRPRCRIAGLVLLVATFGCGAFRAREPDLERLFAAQAARPHTPVIVIPGILGSRLEDPQAGTSVWPGSLLDLVTGRRIRELSLPIDEEGRVGRGDRLVPGEVFFEAFGRDFYGEIVRTLEGPGGYRCAAADGITAETNCVLLSWDWRRDLVEAAARIQDVIDELRRVRGDPTMQVDLVGHSAGGLVARYFVRFGGRDVLDDDAPEDRIDAAGADDVRRIVLIGTPNYGSVSALQVAITGNDLGFGLPTIPPEVMATMPSLFQLMPNPARSWMIDEHGRRADPDLYDVESWRRFQWSVFDPDVRRRIVVHAGSPEAGKETLARREALFERSLIRARRFHQALSAPLRDVATEHVVFGGDCDLTPARCLIETVDGEVMVRLHPREVHNRRPGVDYETLMLEPGDGRVTKASLLARDTLDPTAAAETGFFPLAYAVFICRAHDRLPSDVTFRDNLLNILLY